MDELKRRLGEALSGVYTVEEEIGRGGMSIVFRARDLKNSRQVALKVLRPELTKSMGAERFLREIKISANLEHPHILPLFDSGNADGLLYYTMPLVDGESLRERLVREGPLSLEDALQITSAIGEAIGYANTRGVVHRDIKPENILLANGIARVADFGIARARTEAGDFTSTTDANIAIGTPEYMSPEQAAGSDTLDGRTDIYSLGCVVYEMFTGEPPFTGRTVQAIIAKHLGEKVPTLTVLRPGIPLSIVKVIEKTLAKVPADRFASADELVEALEKARRGRSRLPLLVAAVAVTVAVAVIGQAIVSATIGGNPQRATQGADRNRIAVMYFEDNSPDESLEHIAVGLTEELIDELSTVDVLKVVPAVGMRPMRGRPVPLDSMVALFNAGTIVAGSIDSAEGVLHVRARLVDGPSGEQVESWSLAQPWVNLPALSRTVAVEASRFLRSRLGEEIRLSQRRKETGNLGAWDLVRRAEVLKQDAVRVYRTGDPGAACRLFLESDQMLADAEALDNDWSESVIQRGWLAWHLGAAANMLSFFMPEENAQCGRGDVATLDFADWLGVGIEHSERALNHTDGRSQALELRGVLRYTLMWQVSEDSARVLRTGSEQDLRAAVRANPSMARAWHFLGSLLHDKGEFAEASLAASRALEADAYLLESAAILQLLMYAALERAQFDSAAHWCHQGQTRYPADRRLKECELTVIGWSGDKTSDVDRAWRILRAIERDDSLGALNDTRDFRYAMVATVLARAGLADSARNMMERLRGEATEHAVAELDFHEAYVSLLLDDEPVALRLLERHVAANPLRADYVANCHWFRALRENHQFMEMIAHHRE